MGPGHGSPPGPGAAVAGPGGGWRVFSGTHPPESSPMPSLMEIYMRDAGGVPLLTAEKERELGLQAQAGSRAARRALIVANLRLVVRIAQRFHGRGMDLEDLVEEGNLG